MNCHGAAQALLDIDGDRVDLNALNIRDACKVVMPFRQFQSVDALKSTLADHASEVPLIMGVGFSKSDWTDHSAVFLGFDERGEGVIFQKDNLGLNHPWNLFSLTDWYQRYGEARIVLRTKAM